MDVELSPLQSVVDVERSKFKLAWHQPMATEWNGHSTPLAPTNQLYCPKITHKSVGARWMFTYKSSQEWMVVKPKSTLVAIKGFQSCAEVSFFFRRFTPTLSATSVIFFEAAAAAAAVANEIGSKYT